MWAGSQLAVCAWKAVDDQEWDRPILQHGRRFRLAVGRTQPGPGFFGACRQDRCLDGVTGPQSTKTGEIPKLRITSRAGHFCPPEGRNSVHGANRR